MGWVTPDAPRASELDACIQCGLCLPVCPTFRLTGDEAASPRGRLTAMSAVAEGVADVDATFADMMGFCLQCRACEVACPGLVPFGRAMEGARAEVAAQTPPSGHALRRRIVGRAGLGNRSVMRAAAVSIALAQRLGADRWLRGPLRRSFRGVRRLPVIPPSVVGGTWAPARAEVGSVGLLAGCVMDPWFHSVHRATIATLVAAGYRVVAPPEQTCCGALAAHDGAAGEAKALAAANVEAFIDVDHIVVNAAGCGAHLKELEHWHPGGETLARKVRDVTELVATALAEERLPRKEPTGATVAVQDPCHLRHAQRITEEPRAIVAAGGYTVVEIDELGMCCGAAGLYSVLRPSTSNELGDRKAVQVEGSGARMVASANPGCEMQLRAALGAGYRIAHPVELYAEAVGLV